MRVPWHGEQLREKIAAPARMRSGGKSWAAAAAPKMKSVQLTRTAEQGISGRHNPDHESLPFV
jgi:hypothetical protein